MLKPPGSPHSGNSSQNAGPDIVTIGFNLPLKDEDCSTDAKRSS